MKLHGLTPVVLLISSAESAEATHPPSFFELQRIRPTHSSPGSHPRSFA